MVEEVKDVMPCLCPHCGKSLHLKAVFDCSIEVENVKLFINEGKEV